jgi:uncharacterized protein (DUF2237 family)
MAERNVLGGPLEPCSSEPLTGFYRDGCCSTGPEDLGLHTICAVVTAEFLEHQRMIGNDLSTPMPQFRFPGLVPGDRWCVTAGNWLLAYRDGFAAPVVLASTHERTLDIVPGGTAGACRRCARRPGGVISDHQAGPLRPVPTSAATGLTQIIASNRVLTSSARRRHIACPP